MGTFQIISYSSTCLCGVLVGYAIFIPPLPKMYGENLEHREMYLCRRLATLMPLMYLNYIITFQHLVLIFPITVGFSFL